MAILLSTLTPLIAALKADGYTVIGPAQHEGAIVLTELGSAEDLPHGWGVRLEAGTYRLRHREDTLALDTRRDRSRGRLICTRQRIRCGW